MRQVSRVVVALACAASWVVGSGLASAQTPAAGNPVVVIETQKGAVTIELYPAEAPKTVANFLKLVKSNFYNRQHFHRVEAFVVQVGDPDSKSLERRGSWGRRGNGQAIGVAEISKKLKHIKGAVGMAHAGDATKADSQFYITKLPKKIPEGQYSIFGQVISGMDVVDKIELGDLVKRMYVK
jgi:cyclophilin family peptidyl-prolyl cis-trans isomerase